LCRGTVRPWPDTLRIRDAPPISAGRPAGVAARAAPQRAAPPTGGGPTAGGVDVRSGPCGAHRAADDAADQRAAGRPARVAGRRRSEEHTSELQSRENLVCRLLLE